MDLFTLLLFFGVVLFVYLWKTVFEAKRRLPLPPGPPPLPVLGNLLDIPRTAPWVGYRDMCKKYGNLISIGALGQTIIIIGDARTAVDLLEKRSVNYADRPVLKLVRATGWDWTFTFAQYGQWWRERRRAFWQHFRPDAMRKYRERQEDGVRRLLRGLLASPEKLQEHLRYSITAIVLSTLYGMELAEENDPNVAIFETGLQSVEFLISNSSWVEYLPLRVIENLPTWLPGMSVIRRLAEIHEAAMIIRNMPWKHSKDALKTGDGTGCIAHNMLERISRFDDEESAQEAIAQEAAGAAYSAAIDTQFATLHRFFAAMSLYSDVQKRAQGELDSVLGRNRMPEAEDRARLPYVDALVKEVLRWYPAVPLGVARCTLADDEYNGFFIPKGATVLVNAWAMMHDEKMFPDPERFSPERHLSKKGMDPASVVFGMGRRYFADMTMFNLIASVLYCFDISPRLDGQGQPMLTQPRPVTGIISHLEDWWQCDVRPRSPDSEKLVRSMT